MSEEKRRKTNVEESSKTSLAVAQGTKEEDNRPSNLFHNLRKVQFLPHHLRMLKSLYQTNVYDKTGLKTDHLNLEDGDDDDDVAAVSEEIWRSLEDFLRKRSSLIRCKIHSLKCRGIHQQVLRFLEESKSHDNNIPDSLLATKSPSSTTTIAFQISSTPLINASRTTPRTASKKSAAVLNSPRSMIMKQRNPQRRGAAFVVVSKILGHRAVQGDAAFYQQAAQPFAPLLLFTQEMIGRLKQQKSQRNEILQERYRAFSRDILHWSHRASIRESSLEAPTTTTTNVSQVIDIKIALWAKLEQDLKVLLV